MDLNIDRRHTAQATAMSDEEDDMDVHLNSGLLCC